MKNVRTAVFGKSMKNVKIDRDINLVMIEARKNYLVSKPNCHRTKKFYLTY